MAHSFVKAELEKLITVERSNKIDSVLNNRTSSLTIILDDISHIHNISAVIRSADAFGVLDIHLLFDSSKPNNSEFSDGISLGSEKWVRLHIHTSHEKLIDDLKSKGFSLVALLPPDKFEKTIPVPELPFDQPLALMFGNEVRGLRQELIKAADIHAYIPMYGFVESLNISVACAITLFCSTIEKASPMKRAQSLDHETFEEVRLDWVKKSIQNVDLIERNLVKRFNSANNQCDE